MGNLTIKIWITVRFKTSSELASTVQYLTRYRDTHSSAETIYPIKVILFSKRHLVYMFTMIVSKFAYFLFTFLLLNYKAFRNKLFNVMFTNSAISLALDTNIFWGWSGFKSRRQQHYFFFFFLNFLPSPLLINLFYFHCYMFLARKFKYFCS